jgi:hypothetical protein
MHREIRVYMPNITDATQVAALKDNKPFLMRASIPVGSCFLGATAIPSLIDMMGFSGGGGPPGYAYAVDPDQHEFEKVLFAAVMPNRPLPVVESSIVTYRPLGIAQSVGIIFGHFIMTGPGVDDGGIEEVLTASGGLILDTIVYEPPPILRTLYDPKTQRALTGELQQALNNMQNKP